MIIYYQLRDLMKLLISFKSLIFFENGLTNMNTSLFLKYVFLALCFTTFLCYLLNPNTLPYLVPGGCRVYFVLCAWIVNIFLFVKKRKKKTDSSTLPPCWSNRSSTLAWKETEYCQCLHGNGKFKLALITKILIERILLFPD